MTPRPQLKLLYDGLCPFCTREMAWLRRRDRQGRLEFEDFTAPDFDAAKYDLAPERLIRAMHAITPEGEVLIGVEAFRRAYSLVGLGWMMKWTNWPVLRPVANLAYRAFAKVRPRFQRAGASCDLDRCRKTVDPSEVSR